MYVVCVCVCVSVIVCLIEFEVLERLLVIEWTLCEVSETGGHLLGG